MMHAAFITAAQQALDAGAHAVGATSAAIAVVALLLGVVAMLGVLFWPKWGYATGGDATDTVEHERRERLHQNPAYAG